MKTLRAFTLYERGSFDRFVQRCFTNTLKDSIAFSAILIVVCVLLIYRFLDLYSMLINYQLQIFFLLPISLRSFLQFLTFSFSSDSAAAAARCWGICNIIFCPSNDRWGENGWWSCDDRYADKAYAESSWAVERRLSRWTELFRIVERWNL